MPSINNQNLKRAVTTYLNQHSKIKQWVWFIILWCSGLFSVLAVSAVLKFFITTKS